MATHIQSVVTSDLRMASKNEFYRCYRGADLILCSGRDAVSIGIEKMANSLFSHVLMACLPAQANQWLTLEATLNRGVHVGKLSDYMDGYNGDLVLARRPLLTDAEKIAELNAGFNVLEDSYDWRQEVTIVAHRLIKALPIDQPKKEYYCSGLMYLMSCSASHPLQKPGINLPTPEDNYTDATVVPVCALLGSMQSSRAIGLEGRAA